MTNATRAAERAVEAGNGVGAVLAIADDTASVHLRWAGNAPTANGAVRARRLTVAAVIDGAVGVVSRHGDLSDDAVDELVRAAAGSARRAEPEPDAAPLLCGAADEPPDWRAPAPTPSFDVFGTFVPRLAAAFDGARRRGRALAGYAEHRMRTTAVASSAGLRLRHVQTDGVLDLTASACGGRVSTWAGSGVPDFATADPEAWADRLEGRLALPMRPVGPPPGRYEVLLSPSAVADLMLHLYRAATARDAADGGSVFSAGAGRTRVGDRLTAAPLTLYSDPAEPGLGCAPFVVARASDARTSVLDTGLPLTRTDWIRDGALTALAQTRASARLTGLPCTPGIDNLVLTAGTGRPTPAEMVAGTRRGLLVTSLWYLRDVDPATLLLTGLSRDGVHLVEDGEIVGSVPDFRFTESPVALLDRVTDVGRTGPALPREWGDRAVRTAMPALRIADVALSPTDG